MNCELFHDRLLDLLSGRLPSAEAAAMLEHAAACAECEAVLSFEESLQAERTEGVSENVPEAWVAGMWPRVHAEIGGRGISRRVPGPRPAWGWARMAVAAVLAVLLVGAGYLLGQRGLPGGESSVEPSFAAGDATTQPPAASTFEPAPMTFLAALELLPDGRTLVSAEEARSLLRESFRLRRWASTVQAAMDLSDGLQVGEIRAVLDAMPLDGAATLPASLDAGELRRWLRGRV
jgi:hypothetical protein